MEGHSCLNIPISNLDFTYDMTVLINGRLVFNNTFWKWRLNILIFNNFHIQMVFVLAVLISNGTNQIIWLQTCWILCRIWFHVEAKIPIFFPSSVTYCLDLLLINGFSILHHIKKETTKCSGLMQMTQTNKLVTGKIMHSFFLKCQVFLRVFVTNCSVHFICKKL